MEKLTENDIIFRKLNKNDKELFVNLRIQFLMDCFDVINESEKVQIINNLDLYFDEHINKNNFLGIIAVYNGNIVSTAYLIIMDYPANPNLISG
jgi:hypothetical protein